MKEAEREREQTLKQLHFCTLLFINNVFIICYCKKEI